VSKDFRFFDSRQKYLLFVTTTNEKTQIAQKISTTIEKIIPKKPALKIFDAGLGDGTLLMSILRKSHNVFPTIPFLVMGKEISMEDVRLTVEKLADRFVEHPNMVFVVSNLHYNESTQLASKNLEKNHKINWNVLKLKGSSSFQFSNQLNKLDEILEENWQVERHPRSGNATYKTPSVIVIYREDYEFTLENIIPKNNGQKNHFDLIIASQPYRSRITSEQKVKYVLEPMINALNINGRLIIVQASGNDPGMEIIRGVWPDENPFPYPMNDIVKYLKENLPKNIIESLKFNIPENVKYNLRALPDEVDNGIATSLIFSSWNASTYVGQISDSKVLEAEKEGNYIKIVQDVIRKYDGLWFNDEVLEIEKKN
tara:strand:- start:1846 stop:2955 length:1110 start_codon:yes stop_codon:yes gene_type:complete